MMTQISGDKKICNFLKQIFVSFRFKPPFLKWNFVSFCPNKIRFEHHHNITWRCSYNKRKKKRKLIAKNAVLLFFRYSDIFI